MEVISSVDISLNDSEKFKSILFNSDYLQLKISSKAEFDSLMKSDRADMIYDVHDRIVSIRGPIQTSRDSSLFEDTVLITSYLEDNFGIGLEYITTIPSACSKYIVELSEFFQDTLSIYASTIPFSIISPLRTPYGIVEHIKGIYCDNPSYDKMSYLGMSYNVTELSPVWLGAEVCYSIVDFINEVYLDIRNGAGVGTLINLLSQLKEMGCTPHITYDGSALTGGADIIERLIREV